MNNLAISNEVFQRNDTLLENDGLLDLFISQRYTDCSFEVGSDDEIQVIGAHKAALAMYSPVFIAMFFSPVCSPNRDKTIRVPDIKPAAFIDLLKYIYGGRKHVQEITSFNQLRHLYYAAHKYMMTSLVESCSLKLLKTIDASNACQAYEFGKIFDDERVVRRSLRTIKTRTQNVLFHPSFLDASFDTLLFILDMEPLFISSETVLLDALLKWMRHYCERMSLDFSDEGVKKMIGATLAKIDFLSMTATERSSISESPFFANAELNLLSDSAMALKVPRCRASRRVFVPLEVWSKDKSCIARSSPLLEESGTIQINAGTSYTIKFVSNCDLRIVVLNIWSHKRSDIEMSDADNREAKVFMDDSDGAKEKLWEMCYDEGSNFMPVCCGIKKNQVYTINIKYNSNVKYRRMVSSAKGCQAVFRETICESVFFRVEWSPSTFCLFDSITFFI